MTVKNLGSLFAEISKLTWEPSFLPVYWLQLSNNKLLYCAVYYFLLCPNTGTFSWSTQLGVFTSVLFLLPALSEITVLLTCAVASFSLIEGLIECCIYSFGLLSRSQTATQGLTSLAPNQHIIGFAYWTSNNNSLQMHLVNEESTQGSFNKWSHPPIQIIPMQIARCSLVILMLTWFF